MPGTEARGVALIAVITVVVATWLASQGTRIDIPATSNAAAASAAADRFRADAWFLPDDVLLGFVGIPAGPFLMGSDPAADRGAYENELWSTTVDQATVALPLFYIGRYEVTVAQFRAYVEATEPDIDARALERGPDHPVGFISWPDALGYCRWLETTLRSWEETPPPLRELLNDGWRITLPSEAQWEKAARGTDGRIFPWGDEPRPDRANFQASTTVPVGSATCPECAFGLSDMSGNVWELTRSPYRAYPFDPGYDDVDLDANALWIMRGGSYGDPAQNVRTAIRGGADPGARRPFIGFRIVLTR